jgi:hypothetical protein
MKIFSGGNAKKEKEVRMRAFILITQIVYISSAPRLAEMDKAVKIKVVAIQ